MEQYEARAATLRVLIVEPGKAPYEKEIPSGLTAMQNIVGGLIQALYPFEEQVALICNEEGKMMGLPLNRALYWPGSRIPYDVIAGTFLLCGSQTGEDHFISLSDDDLQMLEERFRFPELFIRIGDTVLPIPVNEAAGGGR